MDFTEGLNPEQSKAVTTLEGPVLILAGAGSGKTRVITHRIANLVVNHQVRPDQILAVTFTNKAAGEMRERCLHLLGEIPFPPFIKTFHSLCLFILRRDGKALGYSSDFTVYDTDLQESLIKEILKREEADTKEFKPKTLLNIFSTAKDSFKTPEEYAKENQDNLIEKFISKIFLEYEAEKKKRNALDFGDLILSTVLLFRDFPEILLKYQNRWKFIMVDEYQDTNHIQYHLVQKLASLHKNICVVGDDDQSIYSWRGADISNILNFNKDYADTLIVKLEENYRSTKNIIGAAASVIVRNAERTDKTLRTNNPVGEKITLSIYQDESEEAAGITKKIIAKKKKGKYADSAVFYRTNSQSRYLEESFRRAAIPYKIFGGFRFFDRKEVKDIIAYLSVIVNPLDSTSLLRVINTPARGIGDTTIERILDYSVSEGLSVFECLKIPISGIKKGTITKLKDLASLLEDLMEDFEKKESPSDIAYELIERSGYRESLETEGTEESFSRLENLNQFVNALKEYEANSEEPSLSEYLNSVSLLTSEEDQQNVSDYVSLMTIHNAKGLEFKNVFIAGMEEGTFPHFLASESKEGVEEERRLCYVAITRARQSLEISYSNFTKKFGVVEARVSSRFIDEIADEFWENKESAPVFGVRRPESPPQAKNADTQSEKRESKLGSDKNQVFREGQKVRHKVYGEGKIVKLTGSGDNLKADVRFGQFVEKKFLLAYTPLEIMS